MLLALVTDNCGVSRKIWWGLPSLSWIVLMSQLLMWEMIGHLISPRWLE